MTERTPGGAAAAADNDVADELDSDAFLWGDDAAADDSAPTDEEIGAAADDTGESGDTQEGDETPEEEQPAPGGDPAAAAAKPAQPAPPAAAAVPPQQQAPAPAAAQPPASAPSAPPQRQKTFHEAVNENFDACVEHLVGQGTFSLAPADAEALGDAAPVFERGAAQVYLRTVSAVSQLLHNTLPTVVAHITQGNNDGQEAERVFYESFPGFDPAQHGQGLTQIVNFVMQANPGLDRNQVMQKAATLGYAHFGITPPARPAGGKTPAAPKTPPNAQVIRRKAFASPGKGGAPTPARPGQQPPKQENALFNINAGLQQDYDD